MLERQCFKSDTIYTMSESDDLGFGKYAATLNVRGEEIVLRYGDRSFLAVSCGDVTRKKHESINEHINLLPILGFNLLYFGRLELSKIASLWRNVYRHPA